MLFLLNPLIIKHVGVDTILTFNIANYDNASYNSYHHDEVKQYLIAGKPFVFFPKRIFYFRFCHVSNIA